MTIRTDKEIIEQDIHFDGNGVLHRTDTCFPIESERPGDLLAAIRPPDDRFQASAFHAINDSLQKKMRELEDGAGELPKAEREFAPLPSKDPSEGAASYLILTSMKSISNSLTELNGEMGKLVESQKALDAAVDNLSKGPTDELKDMIRFAVHEAMYNGNEADLIEGKALQAGEPLKMDTVVDRYDGEDDEITGHLSINNWIGFALLAYATATVLGHFDLALFAQAILFKLSAISFGTIMGFKIDNALFGKVTDTIVTMTDSNNGSMIHIRRAIIVAACVLVLGIGL